MQIEINPAEAEAELDDYFILRLPEEDAAYLRALLHTKPKKVQKQCALTLHDHFKTGELSINDKKLQGRMVHLPTLTDVCKTHNGITLYKTGTISQMFVVEGSDKTLSKIKYDNWPHGIARPLKNVRKQRFRRTMRNNEDAKESSSIQSEISWLLRTDYEAVESRYEILREQTPPAEEGDVNAEDLFGSMSDTSSERSNPSDDSTGSVAHYDIIEFN